MNPYLQLSNVTVSFNGFLALNDLNLDVSKGELRCLIGPNGAGKTTALDLICGKVKQSAGSIAFNGTVLDGLEEHRIARAGIGRKFQVPSVFRELTVRENLDIGCSREPGVLRNLFRFGGSAEADLDAAIDSAFNHPNTGPFLCRQLIQRLVTSNPSAAYIGRVAAVFANNGAGVRGDAPGDGRPAAGEKRGAGVRGRHDPGDGAGPGAREAVTVGRRERPHEGGETLEAVGDQQQALGGAAAFEGDEFSERVRVARVAAEAIAGFGGIGDEPAAAQMGA